MDNSVHSPSPSPRTGGSSSNRSDVPLKLKAEDENEGTAKTPLPKRRMGRLSTSEHPDAGCSQVNLSGAESPAIGDAVLTRPRRSCTMRQRTLSSGGSDAALCQSEQGIPQGASPPLSSLQLKSEPSSTNEVGVEIEGASDVPDSGQPTAGVRGPRIKHVCRHAAVALGKPLATFPTPSELHLSALPSKEKKRILGEKAPGKL